MLEQRDSWPFWKYHALSNDYLVLEVAPDALTPEHIRRLCDRHRGVGADGVLVHEPGDSFRVRIFNPDGSEAEKSGNGLRIFARWLSDHGEVGKEPFVVQTPGGPVTCRVFDEGRRVTVDMGRAHFLAQNQLLRIGNHELIYAAVTLGNPHCVVIRDAVSADEALTLGPLIEAHPNFPNRSNVQFVQVLDRVRLKIEIWERGAGYTLASGSSACAVAAVAHKLDLCDPAVVVVVPGGELAVKVGEDFHICQTGPVVAVARGEWFDACGASY